MMLAEYAESLIGIYTKDVLESYDRGTLRGFRLIEEDNVPFRALLLQAGQPIAAASPGWSDHDLACLRAVRDWMDDGIIQQPFSRLPEASPETLG